jgi:hypothetical protein
MVPGVSRGLSSVTVDASPDAPRHAAIDCIRYGRLNVMALSILGCLLDSLGNAWSGGPTIAKGSVSRQWLVRLFCSALHLHR